MLAKRSDSRLSNGQMLRDRVVAAFEAQAADSADSEIARAIACQSKKRIGKLAVV